MKKYLPIFIVLVAVLILGGLKISSVLAQNSDSTTSDYALDIQEGEKGTANDVDAQNNQRDAVQDEDVQAAADDGDPSTEPVVAVLDQLLAPEEVNESAKLIDNPQATSSENDNGEVLNDQSSQTPTEKPNEDVNTQDDNKAPVADPDTQPQATQPQQEQPLENLQNVEPQGQDQQTNEQPQQPANEGSQQTE